LQMLVKHSHPTHPFCDREKYHALKLLYVVRHAWNIE